MNRSDSNRKRLMWARVAGVILGLVACGLIAYELAVVAVGVGCLSVTVVVCPADGTPVRQVFYRGMSRLPAEADELEIQKYSAAELKRATASGKNTFTIDLLTTYRDSPFNIAEDSYYQQPFVLIRVDLEDGRKIVRVEPTPLRGQPPLITLDIPAHVREFSPP